MAQIKIVDGVQLWFNEESEMLELASAYDPGPHQIHFRQGDLDGACGPYSLLMALAAVGFEVEDERHTYRALRRIARTDTLLSRGTGAGSLRKLLKDWAPGYKLKAVRGKSKAQLSAAIDAIARNRAVLIGLTWVGPTRPEPGHWAVGIGYEQPWTTEHDQKQGEQVDRLFLLDPSAEAPRYGYWNGVLTRTSSKGRVRYRYTTLGSPGFSKVEIDSVLEVVPPE